MIWEFVAIAIQKITIGENDLKTPIFFFFNTVGD